MGEKNVSAFEILSEYLPFKDVELQAGYKVFLFITTFEDSSQRRY
jgi:hypothetical protein